MKPDYTFEEREMLDDAWGEITKLKDELAKVKFEQRQLRNQVRFLEKLLNVETGGAIK